MPGFETRDQIRNQITDQIPHAEPRLDLLSIADTSPPVRQSAGAPSNEPSRIFIRSFDSVEKMLQQVLSDVNGVLTPDSSVPAKLEPPGEKPASIRSLLGNVWQSIISTFARPKPMMDQLSKVETELALLLKNLGPGTLIVIPSGSDALEVHSTESTPHGDSSVRPSLPTLDITGSATPLTEKMIEDNLAAAAELRESAAEKPAAMPTMLDTVEKQNAYYEKQMQKHGLHFFKKGDGAYHVTEVLAKDFPNGIHLSYTDSKITVSNDVRLGNGGRIAAGIELPAGVRLIENKDGAWKMSLPGGREIDIVSDIKFTGGQNVSEGRVILSAPSINEKGRVCIDSYSISKNELNSFYDRHGENKVNVDPAKQKLRQMVPIDAHDPIVLRAYDNTEMTHEGRAWLVRVPAGLNPKMPDGGFYICAEKDLMRIYEGQSENAIEAKNVWLQEIEAVKRAAATTPAKDVRYEPAVEKLVLIDAKRYVSVVPVTRKIVDGAPEPWVNVYGVRDGNFSVDIVMPGDSKIFEMAPKEHEYYFAEREYAEQTYKTGADGLSYKTKPFLAQQLKDNFTYRGFNGAAGDYLVVPLDGSGNPQEGKGYIVEHNEFDARNQLKTAADKALAEGRKPLPLSSRNPVEHGTETSKQQTYVETEIGKPVTSLGDLQAITDETAFREAVKDLVQQARDGKPVTFTCDNRVKMTGADAQPTKQEQSSILYDELKTAFPERHFVFSKPDLKPGDAGYTEIPTPKIQQDGLRFSTAENRITLVAEITLPDGSKVPSDSKLACGTIYDGKQFWSADPESKVWAVTSEEKYIQLAEAGQTVPVSPDAISTDPKKSGQIANRYLETTDPKTGKPYENHLIVRTHAEKAPDGRALLDVYPAGGEGFDEAYKEGKPGYSAAKPKKSDHFRLLENMTVEVETVKYGHSTARGQDGTYYMNSGFGDEIAPTAKNYTGETDARSAQELMRIRGQLGMTEPTQVEAGLARESLASAGIPLIEDGKTAPPKLPKVSGLTRGPLAESLVLEVKLVPDGATIRVVDPSRPETAVRLQSERPAGAVEQFLQDRIATASEEKDPSKRQLQVEEALKQRDLYRENADYRKVINQGFAENGRRFNLPKGAAIVGAAGLALELFIVANYFAAKGEAPSSAPVAGKALRPGNDVRGGLQRSF